MFNFSFLFRQNLAKRKVLCYIQIVFQLTLRNERRQKMKDFFHYFFGQGTQVEFENFTLAHFLPIVLDRKSVV